MSKSTNSQEYLELKTELRSLLISSQQGCSQDQLMRDYNQYNGRKIPFSEMGYSSLIELLRSMPDVARIEQTRTYTTIHGVADESTAHIKKLVMAQKRKKNARTSRGGINRNNTYNRASGPSAYPRNRQASQNFFYNGGTPFQPYNQIKSAPRNNWDTYSNNQNQSVPQQVTTLSSVINNAAKSQTASTSTVANDTFNKATPTRMLASFPPKTSPRSSPTSVFPPGIGFSRETPTIDDNLSVMDEDVTYTEDDEIVAFDMQLADEFGEKIVFLRKRIRQLLLKYPSGVWLSSVHRLYKKNFVEELKLDDFRLKNLMVFFDCVSDFVNSERDRTPESTDRIFFLKQKFVEAIKREQQADLMKPPVILSNITDNQSTINTNQNSLKSFSNGIDQTLVDLSSFVALDFQFEQLNIGSNRSFHGFLGDVENPWIIHIGNTQFIPKRDNMMAQMQDHYNQMSNESIYIIPFEQITTTLSCVYYHDGDAKYYRSSIIKIDPMPNTDILILKLYLVDYGCIVPNVHYHINSTNLKFLHKEFSILPTEVYDCRLVHIHPSPPSINWHDDTRQFIYNFLQDRDFTVEIVGYKNPFYFIYAWIEGNSMNQLLVQHQFAVEFRDSIESRNESIPSHSEVIPTIHSNINNHHLEFTMEENDLKYFIISIEHAYYFVKHPYTRRPCLPCFEVARLLNKDETYVSQLNLIREQELPLETNRRLFNGLRCLPESSKCPHINRKDDQAMIILYDLSAVKDHLVKIKFIEGDVIDAFGQEYDNYDRPGYWNEVKSSYISEDNIHSHQEDLYQRRNLLNLRKEQLVSLSKAYQNDSFQSEFQDIEQGLKTTNEVLHSLDRIHPSTIHNNVTYSSSRKKVKSSNSKMRETLYRIARPFDKQFSLNCRFNHQVITDETFNDINDEEIEERFKDLYRITKNVMDFFILESEMLDDNKRGLIDEARSISSNLLQSNTPCIDRVNTYNDCLQVVEYFQPIIRCSLQRTDLIDTIY